MGFIKLDEEPGKEMLFALINTCQSNILSKELIQKIDDNIIKLVINFKL